MIDEAVFTPINPKTDAFTPLGKPAKREDEIDLTLKFTMSTNEQGDDQLTLFMARLTGEHTFKGNMPDPVVLKGLRQDYGASFEFTGGETALRSYPYSEFRCVVKGKVTSWDEEGKEIIPSLLSLALTQIIEEQQKQQQEKKAKEEETSQGTPITTKTVLMGYHERN